MNEKIKKLWRKELEWIKDKELKEKVADTWALAFEKSILKPDDLNKIPFTLLAGD